MGKRKEGRETEGQAKKEEQETEMNDGHGSTRCFTRQATSGLQLLTVASLALLSSFHPSLTISPFSPSLWSLPCLSPSLCCCLSSFLYTLPPLRQVRAVRSVHVHVLLPEQAHYD